jgi:predicted metalloprotease with PDZ domain
MKAKAHCYSIRPAKLAAHHFEVVLKVADPDPAGQSFALPAWIPGSYLIRDFARHVIAIEAESEGRRVALAQIDKHSWQAAPVKAPLTVRCTIYAFDLSVRGAYVDTSHAFFNGASVFLRVVGQEACPCLVELQAPEGVGDWQVATSLAPASGTPGAAKRGGFGRYRAADYAELIDHPVEMGRFTRLRFDACGVAHEVAISGRHDCDLDRLAADLKRICEWQINFFGEPAPLTRYTFLVTVVGNGYGGLEHRASTALIASRNDLPYRGMAAMTEGYRSFLGLCSHEYFHTWNVKRIKPAVFVDPDLGRENYTRLLWAFEGITSYYDNLALLRSGVITPADWLDLTAKTLTSVESAPGRHRQSLAESSFTAWSKFYKPDENTPNAVVSYYGKGALVALALDLTLRRESDGRVALDDVMRVLWQRHGLTGIGVAEDGILRVAEDVSGLNLKRFFADYVFGTRELPLEKLLAPFAVALAREKAKTPALGARTSRENGEVKLTTVYDGGAAQQAGLAAGDLIVALDGLRVTAANLDETLARRAPGASVSVHAFRRDELMQFSLRLAAPVTSAKLALEARGNRLRKQWLGV